MGKPKEPIHIVPPPYVDEFGDGKTTVDKKRVVLGLKLAIASLAYTGRDIDPDDPVWSETIRFFTRGFPSGEGSDDG